MELKNSLPCGQLALLLTACLGCSSSRTGPDQNNSDHRCGAVSNSPCPDSRAIESSYFGIHINKLTSPWPIFSTFGAYRTLSSSIKWADIETCDGGSDPTNPCYDWTRFDYFTQMARSHDADVMFTLFATPPWASSRGGRCVAAGDPDPGCTGPADTTCVFQQQNGPGICDPPDDIDAVPGSGLADGTNQHFRDFVTALLAHAGPGFIKYWEIWNEPHINTQWNNAIGTKAQIVRMAKDAREIVRSADPDALFTTPPVGGTPASGNWLQPYLQMGGGDYADVIAFHGYPQTGACPSQCPIAEREVMLITNLKTVLANTGQQDKPIFDTENSWGQRSNLIEWNKRVSFVARLYLLSMSQGVRRLYWYGLDFPINVGAGGGTGELWALADNPDGCTVPDNGGNVCPTGIAVQQIHRWTVGASFSRACDSSGTTWTCNLTRPGGYESIAAWDTSAQAVDFPLPRGYSQYRTLSGAIVPIAESTTAVPITALPILLEKPGS